ncbi:hypothetical protein EYF80_035771 [Liparis tanakae]|uniref:Uncharacterized protein n=1 Tax=Liparis tanakae TaxID=230148 RepID=A0A4Z2GMH7_9TELE|nr:hypothetical protein EYF80_035771 [Liparis tanakae]
MAWPFLTDILRRKLWCSGPSAPVPHRTQQGSPGRTNPHRRVESSPTIHSPSPPSLSPSFSSCPTVSLPLCPASRPYELFADKTRGPALYQHSPALPRQAVGRRCVRILASAHHMETDWVFVQSRRQCPDNQIQKQVVMASPPIRQKGRESAEPARQEEGHTVPAAEEPGLGSSITEHWEGGQALWSPLSRAGRLNRDPVQAEGGARGTSKYRADGKGPM